MNTTTIKGIIFTSLLCGLLFSIPTYFICNFILPEDAIMLAVYSGLLFALFLYIYLIVNQHFVNKKYTKAEENILSPVFYKTNGNFNLGNKGKNGNIYFCESGIAFISFDGKPYVFEEVLKSNIHKYEFDAIHMNIYTKDDKMFLITLPDANQILSVLKEKNWIS